MSTRPLTNELAEKARVELNEDPNRVADDIQHLKDWLSKQPHINANTSDQWLLAFLRGCKFSLERTKEKLDMYYSVRSTMHDLFAFKHTDPKFNEILNTGCMVSLPQLEKADAPRTNVIRPGAYDPEKYSIIDVMCVSHIIQKIFFMEDDNAVVAGMRTVIDLDGVTIDHLLQMTPMTVKKIVFLTQDAVPIRMKGAHYLNTPPGFETIFNIIQGFTHEKNKKRSYVHNKDYEAMYKVIPQEILPVEYGGQGGTIKEITEYWIKKVEEYGPWLEDDYQYCTDESKRPGKPRTAENMFGAEGSFRKLDFD